MSVDRLVDEQSFGRFNAALLGLSFLAMLADGYDIASLASAAPELMHVWRVPPQAFGWALSASLLGVLVGAPLLGMAGDRFGRRSAIVLGCAVYGLATLACVWAADLDRMMALRFLTGIGLGGLMPNTIALNSELSPRRLRAALVVLMFTGITAGSSLPGSIQAWLIPRYGWPIMFWIGGVAPLAIALLLFFLLPESVRFLHARPARRAELLATLRRMRPDMSIPDDIDLTADSRAAVRSRPMPKQAGSGLAQLFARGFALLTPLLWLCFCTALMANYFLNSWLPLVLVEHGYSTQQSGVTTSFYHYGGTLGGLLVSVVLGRFGFAAVALLFALAIPAIAAIGLPGLSFGLTTAAVAIAGFCTLGAQFGNNAGSGLLYPTVIRARGVGWALGIGRFGSIVGPTVGAILIGLHLPLEQLFGLAAVPMWIGLLASVGIAVLCYRRLGGLQPDVL